MYYVSPILLNIYLLYHLSFSQITNPKGAPVDFANVTFGFDASRHVVNGMSFSVSPGSQVAVVGPSGSGKSTIVKLLTRMYDTDTGSVLVDGHDVRTLDLDSLRRAIGVVPQDTCLFNDTILNNIRYI